MISIGFCHEVLLHETAISKSMHGSDDGGVVVVPIQVGWPAQLALAPRLCCTMIGPYLLCSYHNAATQFKSELHKRLLFKFEHHDTAECKLIAEDISDRN